MARRFVRQDPPPIRDDYRCGCQKPPRNQCLRFLSRFGETSSCGEIGWARHCPSQAHETAFLGQSRSFELFADDSSLGDAGLLGCLIEPVRQVLGQTYCNCVTHIAKLYYRFAQAGQTWILRSWLSSVCALPSNGGQRPRPARWSPPGCHPGWISL